MKRTLKLLQVIPNLDLLKNAYRNSNKHILPNGCLVGGFNPSEKYYVKMEIFPK